MLNDIAAKNEMRQLFRTRFQSFVANGMPNETPPLLPLKLKTRRDAINTYQPYIYWQEIENKADLRDQGKHFLLFRSTNVRSYQKSMAGGREQTVGTIYTTVGLITVELYISRSSYQTEEVEKLAFFAKESFLQVNTAGGVWFRNQTMIDLPAEEQFFRKNVHVDFEYDSIKR